MRWGIMGLLRSNSGSFLFLEELLGQLNQFLATGLARQLLREILPDRLGRVFHSAGLVLAGAAAVFAELPVVAAREHLLDVGQQLGKVGASGAPAQRQVYQR